MKSEETMIELFGKMPYKPLVEEIKDYAIFHLNIEGRILSWNQGAELIFGYGKEEIIGQDFVILFTPEDRIENIPERELEKASETGRAEDTRWHLRKDGSRFFAQGATTALRDDNGKLIGFAKIARDDTARRQMEQALLESEEKYRIVAEAATDAIISIDEQSRILFINRAATRIFGYETGQMINQPLTMLMPEYLRHLHRAGQQRYLKTGKKHLNWEHIEVPALHRDGHEFPLELSFGEFSKNNKHIFIGIARDVTARKQAEEAARVANELYEIVARTTNDAIWDWNLSTGKLTWNDGVRTLFGYEPEQVSDSVDWWYEHLHPEDRDRIIESIHRVIDSGGQQWSDEYRFFKADGSFAEVLDKGFVIRNAAGEAVRMLGGMTDIAARKRSEGILQRYRLLSEKARDIVWMLRPDGQIVEVNQAAVDAYGYSREELLQMNVRQLRAPSTLSRLAADLKNADDGVNFETVHVRKDGTTFPVEVNANGADFGSEHLIMSIVRDISERRRTEEIIRRTQARLESVLEAGLAGTFFWNIPHDRVVTDENMMRYFSLSEKALTEGVPLAEVLPAIYEEDRPPVTEALTEAIERSGVYQIEYRVNHSDGKMRWLSARGVVERDETGKACELTGFAVDITRIKEAEAALRESEEQLRTLADTIPQLAWMAEPDGFIFWYNRRWYEYTGTTPDDMQGWGWQSVHDAEMLPQVVERWKRSIATGEPFQMEFPLKDADGGFRWFLTRVNPLRDSNGEITRWFGTNTDIHENRIAQQNAEFIDSIGEDLARLTTIDEMMQTIGARMGRYLNLSLCAFSEINESADEAVVTHNWHREDVRGIVGVYPLKEFLTEEFQRAGRAGEVFVVRDVYADERTDGERYNALKIGSFVCVPLIRNGRWRYLLAIHDSKPRNWREDEIELIRELTARLWMRLERARAEEERERLLRNEQIAREEAEQANRLKDEFLATISHELRTPLNAILGWSQMLQNSNLDEAAAKRALETIERNARAQNQLIEDLLDVSRIITGKLRLDVRAVDLPGVIMAAVDAARPAAEAKNIRLQTLLDPQASAISGDPDRLQQVVWNLLSNAIKFTPKNGRVQVRLERVNSHVEIVVSDTGQGIEPEFLPFVFERFRQSDGSTTRQHGGLGLGLAIVRQLVEIHGGTVSVDSAGAGQGATFIVSLPLLPVRREPPGDVPRVHPAAQNNLLPDCPPELSGLRVLLVDDEADSRDLLNFVLESCGAQVETAGSVSEALEIIRRESFDVIISDIGMPEEDGYDLIGRIRELTNEQGGNTPAIALTAYARAEDRVRALRSGFQLHIAKPVESPELIAAVANLAGRTRKSNGNENE
jgi:PAS domain S-box-containing protein